MRDFSTQKNTIDFSFSFFFLINTLIITTNIAHSNSLLDVFLQADRNNMQLKSSITEYQLAKENVKAINAEYDPSLSLNIQPNYNSSDNSDSQNMSLDFSLSLTKTLYNKTISERLSQAELILLKEKNNFMQRKQQIIYDIANAYFSFLSAQSELSSTLLEKNIIQERLNKLQILRNSQLATNMDITEAQLQLDQSILSISTSNTRLNNARKELYILSGRSYSSLPEYEDTHLLSLPLQSLKKWIELANKNNHELLSAQIDVQIYKKNISIERYEKRTSVDFFARYGGGTENINNQSTQNNNSGRLGLNLNIPLYSGGQNTSKVRTAKLQYQQQRHALNLIMREISQNIQLNYLTVQADMQNLRTLQHSLLVSEKALNNVKRGRAAGTRTTLEVLNFSQRSVATRRSYNEAKYKFLIDLANLQLATGVLSVERLQVPHPVRKRARSLPVRSSNIRNEGLTLEDAWSTN